MGSRRSRKLKAREEYQFGNLDEVFERIRAEREGRPTREQLREQKQEKPQPKQKDKEDRENPNHPCYKCIGCAGWTRCVGYPQLLECIAQRKKAYAKKLAESENE